MSPSKQTWHLDKIAQLLPKKVCQNSIKQYSFYIKCNGFSAIIPIISIGPQPEIGFDRKKTQRERLQKGNRFKR